MRYILKYIITDNTGRALYRILDTQSGLMVDTSLAYIQNNNVANLDMGHVESIHINNIEKYSGHLLIGLNDLDTWCRLNNRLDVLKEYTDGNNKKEACNISCGSGEIVNWVCSKCRHTWKAMLKNRTVLKNGYGAAGCSACRALEGRGNITIQGINDLETCCINEGRKDLIEEYIVEKNPPMHSISKHSAKQVWWKCSRCKNEYKSAAINRFKHSTGCPFCRSGTASFPELLLYNYLSECFTTIRFRQKINGMEADIWIPELNLIIDYRGLYWHAPVSKQYIDKLKEDKFEHMGINQLIIMETAGSTEVIGHVLYVDGAHKFKELIQTTIEYITCNYTDAKIEFSENKYNNCLAKSKSMKNSKVVINNITITHPNLSDKWDYDRNGGFRPETITAGTKYKAWFKCPTCGMSYYSFIRKQAEGQGCPVCNGQLVIPGYNDLATEHSEVVKNWDYKKNSSLGIFPNQIRSSSGKKIYWKCHKCGYETYESVVQRTGGSGPLGKNGKPHRCMRCENKSYMRRLCIDG